MSFVPIARTLPQYVDSNGDPYSGAVLKAYAQDTSTPINFATDNTGDVLVDSIALNAAGYTEVSGNGVIPHIEENFKLALYPDQDSANNNTGEIWMIDNIIFSDFAGGELTGVSDGTARTSAVNVGQVQDGTLTDLGITAGAADAYTLTPSVPITAYVSTQEFTAQIHATNLTTTPYLQISSIALPTSNAVIQKLDGSKAEIALEIGDLTANGIYKFKRNSANDSWIVFNPDIKEVITTNSLIIPVNEELTIASGVITITDSRHTIDTESDASTDDLHTINGLTTGQTLILSIEDSTRVVVFESGVGNIITPNGLDITLRDVNDRLIINYDGTNAIVSSTTRRPGEVVQVIYHHDGILNTGTISSPNDNTIPQISEGNNFMTASITPTNAKNKLLVQVQAGFSSSTINHIVCSLFQDSIVNSVSAVQVYSADAAAMYNVIINYIMEEVGTTSSMSFKVNIGSAAGTIIFNGINSVQRMGGVAASSIIITEIQT